MKICWMIKVKSIKTEQILYFYRAQHPDIEGYSLDLEGFIIWKEI